MSWIWLIVFLSPIQTDNLHPNKDTVFFRDGLRRIDFVISYVDDKDEKKQVCTYFVRKTELASVHSLFDYLGLLSGLTFKTDGQIVQESSSKD